MIQIDFDLTSWINLLEKAPAEFAPALSRALNRTGDMVATAVREIAPHSGRAAKASRAKK
jgi:hypothetical protein